MYFSLKIISGPKDVRGIITMPPIPCFAEPAQK